MTKNFSKSETYYNQARASLQQAISWYGSFRRHGKYLPEERLQVTVKPDLQSLKTALNKLDNKIIRISAFGLVSCGKSSLINALLKQEAVATGAIHGVTKSFTVLRWTPQVSDIEVELVDTPGLDEIAGEARANMAREIAQKSDLILFVVAGDITRTEYQALRELRTSQKPLILVFNKIDLYPDFYVVSLGSNGSKFKFVIERQSRTKAIKPHTQISSSSWNDNGKAIHR